ncbi:MAG: 23S rRNA (guanosine(2251)-2'-O)-methyltransferase RlmB [Actinomycetota bacterium]
MAPANRRRPVDDSSVLAGRRPVVEMLRSGSVPERVLIAQGAAMKGALGEVRRRADALGVPVRMVPRSEIDGLAPGVNHQGVVAITARYRYTPLETMLERPDPALLFLDGVMDPHNLGSLLRSADGAGFDGIVIPTHRAVSVTGTVRRISAGAAEIVAVARVGNLGAAIDRARTAGVWILGLDAGGTNDIWSTNLAEPPVGVVCGSEDKGLSKGVRDRCDELVRIPHKGSLESLNVGVAGAIAMFEIARRQAPSDTL